MTRGSDTYYTELPECEPEQPGSHHRLLSTIEEDLFHEGHPVTPTLRRPPLGPLLLSHKRLSALDPELAGVKRMASSMLARLCCFLPPTTRLQEHLIFGEANPAVVLAARAAQLVVAAYAAPLDCVVLLRFPSSAHGSDKLKPGARLLSINTYTRAGDGMGLDPDLSPGPKAATLPLVGRDVSANDFGSCGIAEHGRWECLEYGNPLYEGSTEVARVGVGRLRYTGVYPIIADFLTDDTRTLALRKECFEEELWQAVTRLGVDKLRAAPDLLRDGRPSASDQPATLSFRNSH